VRLRGEASEADYLRYRVDQDIAGAAVADLVRRPSARSDPAGPGCERHALERDVYVPVGSRGVLVVASRDVLVVFGD